MHRFLLNNLLDFFSPPSWTSASSLLSLLTACLLTNPRSVWYFKSYFTSCFFFHALIISPIFHLPSRSKLSHVSMFNAYSQTVWAMFKLCGGKPRLQTRQKHRLSIKGRGNKSPGARSINAQSPLSSLTCECWKAPTLDLAAVSGAAAMLGEEEAATHDWIVWQIFTEEPLTGSRHVCSNWFSRGFSLTLSE